MADTFEVARTTTISASPEEVFEMVGNLEGWDRWSPWAQMDPDMDKTYAGEQGAVGSSYHWSGNRKVGEGKMTITEVAAPNRVKIDLNFIKPFKSQNVTEMTVDDTGDGQNSQVTWRMTGPTTIMTKVMGLIGKTMDKMVGPDFDKGLASLKSQLESKTNA